MTEFNAVKNLHNTVKRVLEIIKAMDSDKSLDLCKWKTQFEERSGKLPKDLK